MHLVCPVVPASALGGGSAAGAVCACAPAAKHPPSSSAATAAHLALVMAFPLLKSPSPLVARWPVKVQAGAVPALPARRRCPMIRARGGTNHQRRTSHDVHLVTELYRSWHPRDQGCPQARAGGARTRQESGRRDQAGLSHLRRIRPP